MDQIDAPFVMVTTWAHATKRIASVEGMFVAVLVLLCFAQLSQSDKAS